MKVFNAQQMLDIDRQAIHDYHIPGSVLMENAGRETVRILYEKLGTCSGTFAPILIGPGNNGGDGLVIGRHLYQHGCLPLFFFFVRPDLLPPDALRNYQAISKIGLPAHTILESSQLVDILSVCDRERMMGKSCYCCVDALFGIGLQRKISGHLFELITKLNNQTLCSATPPSQPIHIVSCDLPSGICSNTGKVQGIAVHARYTVTYGAEKPGLHTNEGKQYSGSQYLVDIGIPKIILDKSPHEALLTTRKTALTFLKKIERSSNSHKGTHGHLLIIAGSRGMTGAATLTTHGGLRSGAGLVSLAVPSALNTVFETTLLPEAMTLPISGESDHFTEDNYDELLTLTQSKSCLVLGPGLRQHPSTAALVQKLYRELHIPIVVDADAINILASTPEILCHPGGPRIFTPHPGELSKMLHIQTTAIQNNRFKSIRNFLQLFSQSSHEVIALLKGSGTIIASSKYQENSGDIYINTTGNSGMATGGMGDVLSGIIGGFICQGSTILDASLLGAFIHGMAADQLLQKYGIGFTASEVCDEIPLCRQTLIMSEDIIKAGIAITK